MTQPAPSPSAKSTHCGYRRPVAKEFLLDAKAAAPQKRPPFMGTRSSNRPGSIAAFVCSLFWLALMSEAIAQVAIGPVGPGAIQSQNRADILRNPATPLGTAPPSGGEGGYVQASPNDNDLGEQQILQRKERSALHFLRINSGLLHEQRRTRKPWCARRRYVCARSGIDLSAAPNEHTLR